MNRPTAPTRRCLRLAGSVAVALLPLACRSIPAGSQSDHSASSDVWPAAGQVVYAQVGMRFEPWRGRYRMYSTNYIGLPKHLPPGSALTFERVRGNEIELLHPETGANFVVQFVERHSMMTIEDWFARQWHTQPPDELPGLTEAEQQAIAAGRCERGMSRPAVLLAIGYPPKSLSPSAYDDLLTYEWKRFRRFRVRFDDSGKVSAVSRF